MFKLNSKLNYCMLYYTIDAFTTEPPAQIAPTESFFSMDGSDIVDLTPSIKRRRHTDQPDPPAVVMVMIHRSLGRLLPESYDPDRRSLR